MSDPVFVDTCILLAASLADEAANQEAFDFMRMGEGHLHAVDVIGVEVTNGLMKAARRKRLTHSLAEAIWKSRWCDYEWAELHPTQPFLDEALHLALKHDAHVYDLLHLLAAKAAGGQLITLDERLVTKASTMRLGKYARLLKGAK